MTSSIFKSSIQKSPKIGHGVQSVATLANSNTIACVAGTLRMLNFRKYNSMPPPATWEEARRRENDYILYGSLHGATLGTFCLIGIYFAHDVFAEIAAVCVTLASATSIAGRNYGSPRMVLPATITGRPGGVRKKRSTRLRPGASARFRESNLRLPVTVAEAAGAPSAIRRRAVSSPCTQK